MNNNPPWWVPYFFLLALVAASFTFTLQGRMSPAEFLAFAAALGFRVPQPEANGPKKAKSVEVEGEEVNVQER